MRKLLPDRSSAFKHLFLKMVKKRNRFCWDPPTTFLERVISRVFTSTEIHSFIAPKAHFQLAAECSRSRDFACPLTMSVCLFVCLSVGLLQGLILIYLATDAVELAKIEATW